MNHISSFFCLLNWPNIIYMWLWRRSYQAMNLDHGWRWEKRYNSNLSKISTPLTLPSSCLLWFFLHSSQSPFATLLTLLFIFIVCLSHQGFNCFMHYYISNTQNSAWHMAGIQKNISEWMFTQQLISVNQSFTSKSYSYQQSIYIILYSTCSFQGIFIYTLFHKGT